jgi:hypothetical protein
MSDLLNTTAIPVDASEPVAPVAPKSAPRVLRAKPQAKPQTGPAMPKAPAANASAADFSRYMREMREWRAAVQALQPRRTKAPVISNKVKGMFFANPTMSSEDIAKKTGAKLVTVKTFRGDAVNTFACAAEAGMLSPLGRKWLEVNRKK